MEKIFNLQLIESEKDYLLGALASLIQIQEKIPKKLQTKNSEILHSIYNKILEL